MLRPAPGVSVTKVRLLLPSSTHTVVALLDSQFALIVFVSIVGLLSVYYYAYAKSRQTFSEDERKVLFVAHVANCKCCIDVCVSVCLSVCILYVAVCVSVSICLSILCLYVALCLCVFVCILLQL